MQTINEIQLTLQNLLNRVISQAEIAKALGTGRANISLRIKNKSGINDIEMKKIEDYFKIDLTAKTNSSIFYMKSMQILNSAENDELEFYYGLLNQGQKCIEMIKK